MRAINEGDPETLDRIAGAIRGRSTRVCHVVASEMDNYEPCMYTDRVLEAVKVLRDQGEGMTLLPPMYWSFVLVLSCALPPCLLVTPGWVLIPCSLALCLKSCLPCYV